ncbi:hypothetical protein NVP1287O_07 [Vibrio phage 1.287.O._10N.286.55.C7]|nr:hypothetical protein NVP1287O_07 [Vibrio phage 1.287.O._10N.286.55.C7]
MKAYFKNKNGRLVSCKIDGNYNAESKSQHKEITRQAKQQGATSAVMIVVK